MAAPQPPAVDMSIASVLQRSWRRRGALAWTLWPLSRLYALLVALRRTLYRTGLLRSHHPGRPVIVVGNVIAGGAGKTPVVIATVQHLQASGWRPGVISRGYGRSTRDCREVLPSSLPSEVGDEPLLIAQACGAPVMVAAQRSQAAQAMLAAHADVDVIVCDDGLQHWALARDIEICVFNDQGVGNGFLLPAGPLREPWPRQSWFGRPWPRAVDHFDFDSWKRPPNMAYSLICTEKDAVKLWQHCPDALAVPLQVVIDPSFFAALDALLPPARLSSAS